MTSILEALREIEEQRRRERAPRTVSVTDAPVDPPRATGLLYPLVAGLAVGVLVVGLVVWWLGAGASVDVGSPLPEGASPPPALPADPPRNAGLAWLERADAPEARFEGTAPPREGRTARARARDEPAPEAPDRPAAGARAGAVAVESIRFAAAPERRTVTLRLDGRRVTLRQGERAAGIEVQLILEDGAYLNRGSDVFFASPDD